MQATTYGFEISDFLSTLDSPANSVALYCQAVGSFSQPVRSKPPSETCVSTPPSAKFVRRFVRIAWNGILASRHSDRIRSSTSAVRRSPVPVLSWRTSKLLIFHIKKFPQEPISHPGAERDLAPRADHGEESYRGVGRLTD